MCVVDMMEDWAVVYWIGNRDTEEGTLVDHKSEGAMASPRPQETGPQESGRRMMRLYSKSGLHRADDDDEYDHSSNVLQ